jgi:hypothetical protein
MATFRAESRGMDKQSAGEYAGALFDRAHSPGERRAWELWRQLPYHSLEHPTKEQAEESLAELARLQELGRNNPELLEQIAQQPPFLAEP